jgi:tRNA-specific 2-thiouridylase
MNREADRAGEIVDESGRVIGRHEGLSRFTVGQRKGICVPGRERLFVIGLRREENQVVVGGEAGLMRMDVRARLVSWCGPPPLEPLEVHVGIRYRHDPVPARVVCEDGDLVAEFGEPQRAVAPGQALVCYAGETVLGGGWICAEQGCSAGD